MIDKLVSVVENLSRPLQDTLKALGSYFNERLLHSRRVKERCCRSFPPTAVRLYQKHIQTGVLTGTSNNDCSVRHASPVDNIRPTMHSHM